MKKIQKDRENILRLIVTLPKSYIYDLVYNVYLPANLEESAQYKRKEEDDAMSSTADGANNGNYNDDDDDDEEEESGSDEEDEDDDQAVAKNDATEDVQDISVIVINNNP